MAAHRNERRHLSGRVTLPAVLAALILTAPPLATPVLVHDSTVAPAARTTGGDPPLVWAGAPLESKWDGGEPASPPSEHHWLANASDQGNWAVDLPAAPGTEVKVYIAPEDKGTEIATRVDEVGDACSGGGGGQFVTVGIYAGETRVGSVTYGHLVTPFEQGDSVERWGETIGKVAGGLTPNEACWSGPHVHLQMFSNKHFACFNKGYSHNYAVHPTNFVGFTGGNVASSARHACP